MREYDARGRSTEHDAVTEAEKSLYRARTNLRSVARAIENLEALNAAPSETASDLKSEWARERDLKYLKEVIDAVIRNVRQALEASGVTNADKFLPPLTEAREIEYHMRTD